MTKYLTLFALGVIGIIGNANATICMIILVTGIPAALAAGIFLENLLVFVMFVVMSFVEILAWISSKPRDKCFNKTLVQIFILISRMAWMFFAGFLLSNSIYDPLPDAKMINNVVIVIAVWLLINNIAGIIYRCALCSPSFRKRFIDASDKLEQKLSSEEAPL